MPFSFARLPAVLAAALLLSACGNEDARPQPAPAIYFVSVELTGLTGGTLTLANTVNGDSIQLIGNGTFTFSERVADGESYGVVVTSNPFNQTCTVSNGSGVIDEDTATGITVRCVASQYSISGTVSGLAGDLLLQNNNGNDLPVSANGPFTFANRVVANGNYKVSVRNQPVGQTCTVSSGTGTASGGDVSGIAVQCVNNTSPVTIGGNVSGLNGTLVIQNNGGNNLTLSGNGTFSFSSPLNSGTAYDATILAQPFGQQCVIANAAGTATADVGNIDIQCTAGTYLVSGTITGLNGIFSLKNNGEIINRSISGAFSFPTRIAHGDNYAVTVNTQPTGQVCTVSNGSGTINGANVINVAVACVPRQYTIGFSVESLAGTLVVANGSTNNTVSADGNYTFTTTVAHGNAYDVTVVSQPAGQTCSVSNPRGTALANVTNIAVKCGFAVNVSVSSPKTLTFTWASQPGSTHYRLLKNADGNSGYPVLVDNLNVTTASDTVSVHLYDWLDASYIVEACNGTVCTDSVAIYARDHMLNAIGYFKASNPGASDSFGQYIALSDDGNTMAVGAASEDSGATGVNGDQGSESVQNSGAVYVFVRSGNTWSQQAYIKASNPDPDDAFGASLAISANGDYLAVAAPGESSNATGINGNQANDENFAAGAVYVFARSGTAWSQQAYIKASDSQANDSFGSTFATTGVGTGVALSADGSTLAVGAPTHATETAATDDIDPLLRGAVYVFTRIGTNWSEQALIEAFNADDNDFFGYSVALSDDGNTLAASAPNESSISTGIDNDSNNNLNPLSGAVYVYTRSGAAWNRQAYVKASNTGALDRFGHALSLSGDGNTLAVASMFEDSDASSSPSDNSATDSGALYVFTRSGSLWEEDAMLKDSNGSAADSAGLSMALSADGNTLVAGTIGDDSAATGINGNSANIDAAGSGAAIVFRRTSGTWTRQAYVKASNTESSDTFGYAVALSADGGTLAVGATRESSEASGVGGAQNNNETAGAGAVYLY